MNNIFNSVEQTREKTNVFDLSHDVKLSCNMGYLVPTLTLECVPGDKIKLGCESLVRFAPMVTPPMHRMDVSMHYFFVPNRILWPNWDKFITQTPVAGVIPAAPFIQLNEGDWNANQLFDYMGIPKPPTGSVISERISALPFAAFQMIVNEYFRDQNLQSEISFELIDGDNGANSDLYEMRKRCWEHDYFTAALPFAQKGAAVTIPLAGFTDVPVNAYGNDDIRLTGAPNDVDTGHGSPNDPAIPPNSLYAETSSLGANSTSISDLRRAYSLQALLEKMARGGTRLKEWIWSIFGVKVPDARLQRPEYITGTKSPVIISEVLNTTGTDDAAQGSMAGHALSVTAGKIGSYSVQEHGFIIGIMSILPKTAYQQGIHRSFLKLDPLHYFLPDLQHIGEQPIENRELYAFAAGGDDTFGYIPRFSEYKYMPSRVAGAFRTSLDFWHMGRIFNSAPALNAAFVEADPTNRIFAVTDPDVEHLYCHVLHKITAVRGMAKYGTPSY